MAFSEDKVFALEALIDEFDSELPPLTTFILPGGGKCSSQLHVARSICRRAERETLPLVESEETDRNGIFMTSDWSEFHHELIRNTNFNWSKRNHYVGPL